MGQLTAIRASVLVLAAAVTLVAACGGGGNSNEPAAPQTTTQRPGTLALSESAYSVSEGANTLMVSVIRTGGSDGEVGARISTASESADEDDYVTIDEVLRFADQDTANKTVEIQLNDDQEVEGTEAFLVLLTDVTGGATIGIDSARVTLTDNDRKPQTSDGGRLNDTGADLCLDPPAKGPVSCAGSALLLAQDGAAGRDADEPDDADGRAGFVFTKLDSAGQPLADQGADYMAEPWDCVQDEVTGLTWEVKTAADARVDLGSGNATFVTWDPEVDRQQSATAGSCTLSSCTTSAYVEAQNDRQHCGYADWRIPEPAELLSLVDYGGTVPMIDSRYFPNAGTAYWANGGASDLARPYVSFATGVTGHLSTQNDFSVRLVRGGTWR